MRDDEFLKTGIDGFEFAELWLRKYYPNRKKTKVVDLYYEWDTLAVYYNKKIGGYDSNHFEYSYIVDFMHENCKTPSGKKAGGVELGTYIPLDLLNQQE